VQSYSVLPVITGRSVKAVGEKERSRANGSIWEDHHHMKKGMGAHRCGERVSVQKVGEKRQIKENCQKLSGGEDLVSEKKSQKRKENQGIW